MQQSNIPTRIVTAFATNAGPYVPIIPETTATEGRASWSVGFPSINFVDKSLGGIPPDGTDMNGVLQAVSAWSRWGAAGGPIPFDGTYSTAVGGYPKNSLLTALTVNGATAVNGFWRSLVENNTVNPDSGLHANWQFIGFGTSYNGNPNGNVAGVAFATTGLTQSLCWDSLNKLLWVCVVSGNAATAQWQAAGIGGNTGVSPGTYTYSTVQVDALGRVVAAANGAIATVGSNGICRPDNVTVTINGSGQLTALVSGGSVTNVGTGAFLTGGPISTSGTISGVGAIAAEIQSATAGKIVAPDQLFASAAPQVLSDNASIVWNMNAGYNAKVTRSVSTANVAAPSNARLGGTYSLQINSGAGGTTTTFDACFDFGFLSTPTLSTAAAKDDFIFMQCYSTSPLKFRCTYSLAAP